MRLKYPRYKLGELKEIGEELSKKDKDILKDFLKKCSITAGENKVLKIKRLLLQFRDITELPLRHRVQRT